MGFCPAAGPIFPFVWRGLVKKQHFHPAWELRMPNNQAVSRFVIRAHTECSTEALKAQEKLRRWLRQPQPRARAPRLEVQQVCKCTP